MKKLSLRAGFLIVLSIVFTLGLCLYCVIYVTNAEKWAMHNSNRHLHNGGVFTEGGDIYDTNGTLLCTTKDGERRLSENRDIRRATLHTVGDPNGFISTGVGTNFKKELSGWSLFSGLFPKENSKNDITLTVDSDISVAALDALGDYSGTVGMINYETGEVLCMVSTPTYDIENEKETQSAVSGEQEGIFINRFLSSTYPPGSTFKIVTAAAAIETLSDAYDRTYNCKGKCTLGEEEVKCTGYHGDISLKDAFAVSCNCYFSSLAVDLGKETMTEYAKKFGFGEQFYLEGIAAAVGKYDVSDARTIEFGWSGIGQYTDMANPLQYLTSVCAVANGGSAKIPYIIKEIKNSTGMTLREAKPKDGEPVVAAKTAKRLTELMAGATKVTYGGKEYFGGLDICGKTGTAEVDGLTPHAEFIGFCRDEKMPVAFYVVVEQGDSGNHIAKNVANRVLQAAKQSFEK